VVQQGEARECIAAYVLNPISEAPAAPGASPLEFDRLVVESAQPVRSGERVAFTISGRIERRLPPEIEGIVVTVRSAQTGQTVFTTSTARLDLALPATGPFEIAVELQLNVPPGIYGVETRLWDRARGTTAVNGPSTYLQVDPGADFNGTVQMNPSMRLRTPTAAPLLAREA
jgi:hypothetical protein